MAFLATVSRDLDWRERELGAMKILLDTTVAEAQRLTLLRAAWALLYAHFEGSVKFSLDCFFEEICRKYPGHENIPSRVLGFIHKSEINRIRSLSAAEFLQRAMTIEVDILAISPDPPEVDAESNLTVPVLLKLLNNTDISEENSPQLFSLIESEKFRIRTLVARRNAIAHGENNMIQEVSYYLEYENMVSELIYNVAYALDARVEAMLGN